MLLLYILILVTFETVRASPRYFWRDYRGEIPEDAISSDGIYVAQVAFSGALPASFYPKTKKAVTEWFGRKLEVTQGIKLLCDENDENLYWEHTNVGSLTGKNLEDMVVGGEEAGSELYIGKVYHDGEWKIGKVFPSSSMWKGFRGWDSNGNLYNVNDFQVLKYRRPLVGDVRSA